MEHTNLEENKDVLGLSTASNPKDAEYNLVESLLRAADFKSSEENIVACDIKRNGQFLFAVHVHPIGDSETRQARKKATVYTKNPQGPKYPPIEKEFKTDVFHSWIIYLATTPEDQEKIWGNQQIKSKFGLMENAESVDTLMAFGEKTRLVEKIYEISGMDDDSDDDDEGYAKK